MSLCLSPTYLKWALIPMRDSRSVNVHVCFVYVQGYVLCVRARVCALCTCNCRCFVYVQGCVLCVYMCVCTCVCVCFVCTCLCACVCVCFVCTCLCACVCVCALCVQFGIAQAGKSDARLRLVVCSV